MADASKFLGAPLTANYRPAVLGYGMIQSLYTGQVPLFMLGEVEAMRADPQVQLSVAILRAPLTRLKWTVKADSPAVARYVGGQFRKVWTTSLRQMLHYVEYGNAAGEPLWCEEGGFVVFDKFRDVYPRDALPLMQDGGIVGVQVKGVTTGGSGMSADAGRPGSINLFPPRAFWVAHRARHGSPYGYSRYNGAWWPWLEKRGRHGATDIRRGWYVKNAFRGMRIRHPPGMIELPDGSLRTCQDYAREIVEKAETGGVLALPNAKDPTTGEYLWVIEDAQVNGELVGVREYSGDLDAEILQGFEIPPEVARAAETGSGWSGRSVPFMVFLAGEDELAAELIQAITCWILRPAVDLNFGPGHAFCVEPVSLVELLSQPEQGSQGQGGQGGQQGQPAQPGEGAGGQPPGADRPVTAQRVRLSLEDERAAHENASTLVDAIIQQGSEAGVLAATEVRRKVRALVRRGLPQEETLRRVRRILARYEPVLAGAFSDSLLSAWVAGAARATKGLPAVAAPATEPPSPAVPPAQGPSLLGRGGSAPPPLVSTQPAEGEPEPAVRLPVIEEAARDLQARRILTRADFDALADEAKTTAFTAARVAGEEALGRIAEALALGVERGGTLDDFTAAVEAALGEGALSPGHIENVFRTNVSQAYTTGLMETLAHPLVADEFPYLAYTAVHDTRTRPEHRAMERMGLDGTHVYRRDDPIWQRFMPPWDYQCRCSVIPLSVEDAAALGVREAREWLETGIPPARPQWVAAPPFSPPEGWHTRPPVRLSTDDEGHEHDKLGQFTSKGGGGKAAAKERKGRREKLRKKVAEHRAPKKPAPKGPGPGSHAARRQAALKMRKGIRGLFHNAGRSMRVAMAGTEKKMQKRLGRVWDKLPGKVKKSITFTAAVAQKVLYANDTPLRMGLNLAKTVARERGLSEAHVQKVARVVNAVDQVSTLPVIDVYARAAKAMVPAIGPVAGYIPVAALSYVAYSTARNPFATIRAARHLVRNFRKAVTTHMSMEADKAGVAALLEAYERHKGDDWFDALLHAAIDQTHDVAAAIRVAERARAGDPGDEE